MALETGTYIADLSSTSPAPTDSIAEGSQHILATKRALKATFPNMDAPVTASVAQLNSLEDSKFIKGMIMPFWGDALPAKWAWCDGNNGTPNLNDDVFLMGATAKNLTGGSNAKVDLTEYVESAEHKLTVEQLPPHSFKFQKWSNVGGADKGTEGNNWTNVEAQTNTVGGGQAHKHNLTKKKDLDMRPKFMSVKYIMYTGA